MVFKPSTYPVPSGCVRLGFTRSYGLLNSHSRPLLSAARVRLIADRRSAAIAIADESRRGLNGDSCDALILIQTTVEAIDRALADEAKLAREETKGVFIKASEPQA
jgi:hypothetical protein